MIRQSDDKSTLVARVCKPETGARLRKYDNSIKYTALLSAAPAHFNAKTSVIST